MNEKTLFDLIVNRLSGYITPEEETRLNNWIESDPENKKRYESVYRYWESGSEPDAMVFNTGVEWKALKARLDPMTVPQPSIRYRPHSPMPTWRRNRVIPAFAVLSALLVTAAVLWMNRPLHTQLETPNGKTARVNLSDGSFIQMNSGSKLRFPKRFAGDERNVYLQGEAFFQVANGGVPFNVITENAKTQVLGTQFNVWARKGKTRVVVKEGCVKLSASSDESTHVVLKKNEMNQVVGDDAPGETQKVDAVRLVGWIENRLTFESVPLEEVVDELERFHDIRIRIDNRKLVRSLMTGEFHCMTVQKILESICLTLGASLRKEGEVYVIF